MAGSIVVTTTQVGSIASGITKYSIAWTSDASGNVNTSSFAIRHGHIMQVKFAPGVGVSANYGATLPDADGVDLFAGKGTSLSASAASIIAPVIGTTSSAPFTEDNAAIVPTLTGCGNAATGRIDIFVGP